MTQDKIQSLLKGGRKYTVAEMCRCLRVHESTVYAELRKMHLRGEVGREWENNTYRYFIRTEDNRIEDLKRGLI